ncbi:SIS domain-containing protein [Intrasporangium oryzae]|uniref:SIS domain-containing protein n=1 Tax=Intrasporangium oryzae TaxID=412687 RepID=UPI001FE15153
MFCSSTSPADSTPDPTTTVFDEARLDDQDTLERLDRSGTLRALAGAGAQVRRAVHAADEAGLSRLEGLEPRGVVVAAAGGSTAVADLLDAATRGAAAIPVQGCSSGPLPGWVGALDLVVAVSQSGRASGTLGLAAEAARRGATLLTVGAPDSPLAEVSARARGIHVPITVPGASSRTSMWAQATPVLLAADVLRLAPVSHAILASLADVLDDRAQEARPSSESFVNPAKVLAVEVAESVPIVLGSGWFGGVAARRAAAMFGRTGRVPVASGVLPDAASQIVACFDGTLAAGEAAGQAGDDIFIDPFLDGPMRAPLRLIMLRGASAPTGGAGAGRSDEAGDEPQPQVPASPDDLDRSLVDMIVSVAEDAGVRVSLVDAVAPEPLLRLASHVALTDFAATYLALGQGFDPATSPHVRLLRKARHA